MTIRSVRPLETELRPHPAEVIRGAALPPRARGHVLHGLEKRNELGPCGLDPRRLAWSLTVECGERLIEPPAIVLVVELTEYLSLHLGRDVGRPGRGSRAVH